MNLIQYAAPTFEPITLIELAEHLCLDSDTLAESLTPYTCTPAGSHPVVTGYTLLGTAIEVIGKRALVYLRPTNNGTGATVDCKIQESDDNTTWTDWIGGAFTQITEANDTVIQEKEYTGAKRYIRTASKTLVQACEFGTDVIVKSADSTVSDDLTDAITDGRETVEKITRRILATSTWDYYLDRWPYKNFINIIGGNLQSVTSVSWKDTDGTETTLTVGTDYLVEPNGEQCGRIVLPYNCSWPSGALYPSNPIKIRYIAGWTTAALIPKNIKRAVKFAAEDAYYHFDRHEILGPAITNLVWNNRIWEEF